MQKLYTRLNQKNREEISRGLAAGWTFTHIAFNINRPVSTVLREVRNNCRYKRCYWADSAQQRAYDIRHKQKQPKRIEANERLRSYVLDRLRMKWSPEEIAKRLEVDYPDNMTMHISHESIYMYLYCLPKGELKKELLSCLRQKRKVAHAKRSTITDFISISERPKEVIDRIIPGHWEGDLIMGSKKSNSALGTLVERTTRYLLLVPLVSHDALTVRTEFAKAVKRIPKHLKKSLTYDRGIEMCQHRLFTEETRVQVYFADPHSPWQRGTNENTNGLIRQYFPQGIDFRTVNRQEIKRAQDQLNDRPRKALGFYKPNEAFSKLLTLENLR
ncbi:IS30 family transposase [Patescibacteria group bacterium]|nr:IS30 family transposase [Patescibacteria group bacterium]MBU1890967.1 IS30 family transposase [Patescibacteria group bacterium]